LPNYNIQAPKRYHSDMYPIFSDIFFMNQYICLFVEVEKTVQNFDTYSFAKIKEEIKKLYF